ncbi:hypothetical protein PYCCODRAFT_336538 [Trametes coccinea BRFM310]|uniref:Uncharacterized protein n=1 Tax=Trametes coccinea (strain BRFM310) TaxID=1353009 RepID=A0A1Y2J618_TRAC3|nr:hypothetical protein PYCCODRAFT_336538 [Trametes coccinea BRFM310]
MDLPTTPGEVAGLLLVIASPASLTKSCGLRCVHLSHAGAASHITPPIESGSSRIRALLQHRCAPSIARYPSAHSYCDCACQYLHSCVLTADSQLPLVMMMDISHRATPSAAGSYSPPPGSRACALDGRFVILFVLSFVRSRLP